MNKMTIGIVVVVVVVIGIVAFILTGKPANGPVDQTVGQPQSLAALLAGGAQQCSFSYEADGATSAGTMYVANGRARGDFSTTIQGRAVTSHMIIADETMYTWQDGVSSGLKLAIAADAAAGDEATAAAQPLDVNQALDYDCGAWAVNSAMFDLPSGVTFTDFSAMMPANTNSDTRMMAPSDGSAAPTSQCAACDQVPAGESRDACLAALGC